MLYTQTYAILLKSAIEDFLLINAKRTELPSEPGALRKAEWNRGLLRKDL